MKKKIAILFFITGLATTICSCGTQNIEENKENNNQKQTIETEVIDSISFADLKDLQFVFSSGVGAWATVFSIEEDGSFSGEYFDTDMGVMGEDYPNGTMYQSIFTGKFSEIQKVNEYTYSMQISELNYEREVGTEEIKDDVKYVYSGANGLENGNRFFVYLPNAPIKQLPEEFINWAIHYKFSYEGDEKPEEELSFYGLYNEEQQVGFLSYQSRSR